MRPPPQAPSRPVDGTWDLPLICPDKSAVNEFGAIFVDRPNVDRSQASQGF